MRHINIHFFTLLVSYAFSCYSTESIDHRNSHNVSQLPLLVESSVPEPSLSFPLQTDKHLCFLKNIITRKNIIVGDYSYYYDNEDVHNFEKNVVYHFEEIGDRLIIGKFCQIGMGTKFIMNGGNHRTDGYTTYPFHAFGGAWGTICSKGRIKGDTIIENDVWLGYGATIMSGVRIGSGAIVAALAVVTKDVEPYSIVAGNPAKLVKLRFDEDTVSFLLNLKWWDWPIEKITRDAQTIVDPMRGGLRLHAKL